MRPPPAVRRGLSALTIVVLTASAAGCGDGDPVEPAPATSTGTAAPAVDARTALAAHAARAEDRRYAAVDNLDVPGWAQRQVVATTAVDGSWRVDIPAGALGGTADVSIVQIEAGIFQCSLPTNAPSGSPTCVKVADPGDRLPRRYDPRIQRVFHDWLNVLTDRQAPLSVSAARPLEGVPGSCYAVESISASLKAPLDVGIYCYAEDGLLTGARVEAGELRIAAAPAKPPPSVDLPGPVVAGDPMGMDAPPPPPEPTLEPLPSGTAPA